MPPTDNVQGGAPNIHRISIEPSLLMKAAATTKDGMSKSQTSGFAMQFDFINRNQEFQGLRALPESPIRLDQMVTLGMLKGTSLTGPVKKMLHAPTLKMYCLKEVPISSREARHMLKEWMSIWENNFNQCQNMAKVYGSFWNSPEGCVSLVSDYSSNGSLQVSLPGASAESHGVNRIHSGVHPEGPRSAVSECDRLHALYLQLVPQRHHPQPSAHQ